MSSYVIMINDTPKFLTNDLTPQAHAIVINIEESDADNDKLILPLSLKVVTPYLKVYKTTKEKWQSKTYLRLKLKSEHIEWNTTSTRYTEQEESMTDYQGEIVMPDPSSRGKYLVINSLSSLFTPISDITDDDNFSSMLKNKVQVSATQSGNVNSNQGRAVETLALSKQ